MEEEKEVFYQLAEDMERNPHMYKEYIEEIYDVEPDYPSHGSYIIVDHHSMNDMGGNKPCFRTQDDAVQWAEEHLNHNDYNVYQLKCVM